MNLAAILALAGCGACVSPPELPHVRVVGAVPSSDPRVFGPSGEPVDPEVLRGVRAWEAIGFDVSSSDPGLDECPHGWVVGDELGCQFTVGVVRSPGVSPHSLRSFRIMYIGTEAGGASLMVSAAHEAGHILLDTASHTPTGVMSGRWGALSDDDLELACASIGACM